MQRLSTRPLFNVLQTRSSFRGLHRAARLCQHQPTQVHPSNTAKFLHPTHTPISTSKHDDETLRLIFDNNKFWTDFSINNKHSTSADNQTGIFDNPYLTSPEGIRKFTQVSLTQAQSLTVKIIGNGASISSLRDNIRNLDRLSDILCQVIDLVGFVRMSHPDPRFVQAAQESHEIMFDFMNFLNTSVELYQMLETVMGTPEILNSLTEEEKMVGKLLLADFKKSGIDLKDPTEFINLSSKISVEGQQFMNNANVPVSQYLTFPSKKLADLEEQNVKITKRFGRAYIPSTGNEALMALRYVKDEDIRRKIWIERRRADPSQVKTLESFLTARQKLAKLMGKSSYAEYELHDKMVKSPENVKKFLEGLANQIYPLAKEEIAQLKTLKDAATDIPNKTEEFQAWDREYFGYKYWETLNSAELDIIPQYFSLGSVMQGLSKLFQNIYGIRFVPVETKPGEIWRDDVRRLDVISEDDGRIGIIYCDLFQRPGKSPNPAHFTVRCSRRIFEDENDEIRALDPLANVPARANGIIKTKNGQTFQLPIISLVCDFTKTVNEEKCLLSFSEVETLFHEMGHAMHSMLGRTALHNVSGTRCVTDFVELPSVLMENFASSPEVVQLFARHHETNEPLPLAIFDKYKNANRRFMRHSETYSQIKLALLDQAYHDASGGYRDTMSTFYELEADHGLFPPNRESMWPAQFGHLFGYGASYYCYLFDRAIADRIWAHCFSKNPISREAGEHLKTNLLQWGGSKDPWQCVADVLEKPEIAKGDERAMQMISDQLLQ
ncbi:hypothetical protein DV454_000294 [Geotrichum candidum]|nr:hypothetical protein DV454_000294 [Geotrichum candidum]